jgi:hypothetical protein
MTEFRPKPHPVIDLRERFLLTPAAGSSHSAVNAARVDSSIKNGIPPKGAGAVPQSRRDAGRQKSRHPSPLGTERLSIDPLNVGFV